jgi:hypothetical protein
MATRTLSENRRNKRNELIRALDNSLLLSDRDIHGDELVAMLREAPNTWWRQLANAAGVNPPSHRDERELGVSLRTRKALIDVYEMRTAGAKMAERRAS